MRTMIPVLMLAIFTLTSPSNAHEIITRVSDNHNVTFPQLMTHLENSDLVLVGESHDKKSHHEIQLSLIKALYAKHLQVAIGMEMMEMTSQQQLDDWVDGKIDEARFQEIFAANWSPDWNMYRDIFIFARDNHIPMVALNVHHDLVRKVAHQGFASLSAEEKKDLPQGTSCDLKNPHTAFLKKTFEGVFTHTQGKSFSFFCEAQTLRNSGMALNISRYLKKHPGTKFVGLTGIWHAIKNAIPEQLERNGSKVSYVVILPDIPELQAGNVAAGEADYLIDL